MNLFPNAPHTESSGSCGRFGYDPSKPICADGQWYCARLRCAKAHPFWFHRLCSCPPPGPDGHILDQMELLCFGRETHITLYFDMYHGSETALVPEGLSLGKPEGRGTTLQVFRFPEDLQQGSNVDIPEGSEKRPQDAEQSIPLFAGLEAIHQQNWIAAITAYREVIRQDPSFSEAWVGLGVAYQGQGDYANAVQAYQEALRRKPDHPGAWFGLGEVYVRQGKAADAIKALKEAIRLEPARGEAWSVLGEAQYSLEDYGEAATAFREAIRLNPGLAEAWFMLGQTCEGLDQRNQAIAAYGEALRLQREDVESWCRLGVLLAQNGEAEAAIFALMTATSLRPDYAEAWYNLGVTCFRSGLDSDRYETSIHAFRECVRHDSSFFLAWYSLGVIYARIGRTPEAISAIERAAQLQPENADVEEFLRDLRQSRYGGALPSPPKGQSTRQKIDALTFAVGIAGLIRNGTVWLASTLKTGCGESLKKDRAEDPSYLCECFAFNVYMYITLLEIHYPNQAELFAGQLLEFLQAAAKEAGIPDSHIEEAVRLAVARSEEYAKVAIDTHAPSLFTLGLAAWKNITASDDNDPFGAIAVAVHWRASADSFAKNIASGFEVTSSVGSFQEEGARQPPE